MVVWFLFHVLAPVSNFGPNAPSRTYGKKVIPSKVRVQLRQNGRQVCQTTANDFKDPRDAVKVMNKIVTECSQGNVSSEDKGLYVLRDKLLLEDR